MTRTSPLTTSPSSPVLSGIGRATAVGLAANGLTVVGADIDADGLDATGDRIEAFDADGTFHAVETDLTDDDAVEAVVEAAAGEGTLRGFSVSVGYVLTPLMVDQSRTQPKNGASRNARSSRT